MSTTDVYLSVPLLNQREVFPTPNKINQACWYTSAFMVILYRMGASGTVNMLQLETLKRLYSNKALGVTEDSALAKEIGLEHSPSEVLFSNKDKAEYCKALAHLGPLVVSEPTHVVVITGCISDISGETKIIVNNPSGGIEQTYSLEKFNSRIDWSYPIHFRRTQFEPPKVFKDGPNMHPFQSKY